MENIFLDSVIYNTLESRLRAGPDAVPDPEFNEEWLIKRIQTGVSKYGHDLDKVAEVVGLHPDTVSFAINYYGIKLPKKKFIDKRQKMFKLFREKCRKKEVRSSIEIIAPEDREKKILELIEARLSLEDIGRHLGVTREMARRVINKFGLHETWKKRRKELKDGKINQRKDYLQSLENILGLLKRETIDRAYRENEAFGNVIEYYSNRIEGHHSGPKLDVSLQRLSTLFHTYHDAVANGEKLSLYELEKISGIQIFKIFWI